jgi:hypothetical protein
LGFSTRGPIGCIYFEYEDIDDGTLSLHTNRPTGPAPDPLSDADKAEFKIIQKMHVANSRAEKYTSAAMYVEDRNRFFGSATEYAKFAIESDTELVNTTWGRPGHTRKLGDLLEFSHNAQQQAIFYRWVRKAYKKKFDDDVDVPQLIRKGMSDQLAEQLKEVRASVRVKNIHDENFHAGGFNPRPMKLAGSYRLGTLSEHATGMAVDIDDTQNAQFTLTEWKAIENIAGKSIVRKGRWDTEEHAKDLWTDIQAVNDLFVSNVASKVKAIEAQRTADLAAKKPLPAHQNSPMDEVLGANAGSLRQWTKTGFFHLPLDLVLELHTHGFTWGATFSGNVDLHHFELDDD